MRLIAGMVMILSLSACSNYGMEFDCKAGKGMGCKSISQVNDLVNQGGLDSELTDNKIGTSSLGVNYRPNGEHTEQKIKRVPERTARVWINGFTDEQGDFVDATHIYTVLFPGSWEEMR